MRTFMLIAACVASVSAGSMLAGPAVAEETVVTVDDQQIATVTAENVSLRAIVEDLCWQADVPFQYDTPDKRVTATHRARPLVDVLNDLLREENYVLKVRAASESGGQRVSHLHVLRKSPARGAPAAPPTFVVPVRVLEATFGDRPDGERAQAMQALVDDIRSSPQRLQAFLGADPTQMSQALRAYPEAPDALARLAAVPDLEPELRRKIQDIAAELQQQAHRPAPPAGLRGTVR